MFNKYTLTGLISLSTLLCMNNSYALNITASGKDGRNSIAVFNQDIVDETTVVYIDSCQFSSYEVNMTFKLNTPTDPNIVVHIEEIPWRASIFTITPNTFMMNAHQTSATAVASTSYSCFHNWLKLTIFNPGKKK